MGSTGRKGTDSSTGLKTLQNARICNQRVGDSNPSAGTTIKSLI
jgi:hypothetical protein